MHEFSKILLILEICVLVHIYLLITFDPSVLYTNNIPMISMRISLLLIWILIFVSCQTEKEQHLPDTFQVIPQPREVKLLRTPGIQYDNFLGVKLEGTNHWPHMGEILSGLPRSGSDSQGVVSLVLDTTGEGILEAEGYMLTISRGKAEVRAVDNAGIFYGCQTLEQLLEDGRDHAVSIPACVITDYPAMAYRAVHFDVKHHLDHLDYYYQSIDRLARYKINAVIFEVEDKLGYERQATVASPQSISIEEMAALTRYAAERHIEISPLVQGLGHATFILKHPEYQHLREIPGKNWVSCSVEAETYELYQDLFLDAFEATPGSRFVHIGGDEIGDLGLCERCRAIGDEIGQFGLYLHWLKQITSMVHASGRIPILWDDMPLKMAGVYESTSNPGHGAEQTEKDWEIGEERLDSLIDHFPENCVYMRWNYEMGTLPGNVRALEWYHANDFPAMISTAAQTNAMLFPKDERTGDLLDRGPVAIRSFIGLAAEKQIDGMLCTAWDDQSLHFETYWRGFITSAEYSWTPGGRTLDAFDEAYLQREYGLSEADYYPFYSKLTAAASFWGMAYHKNGLRNSPENALFTLPGLAHWIPEAEKEGQLDKTDFTDQLIELPDIDAPGKWSESHQERLTEAVRIMEDYKTTSAKIDGFAQTSSRNQYHWEVFRALNEFQMTAPGLLLALDTYDTAPDDTSREEALSRVGYSLDQFDLAWESLKEVYSRTRYFAYPAGHVPDRYYHFASQREDLSWMIQTEELFHKMVRNWMSHCCMEHGSSKF